MAVSKKYVDEFKEIFKKEHNKDLTDDEAQEAADNLVGFFELLWKCAQEDANREQRLKKEPKGDVRTYFINESKYFHIPDFSK